MNKKTLLFPAMAALVVAGIISCSGNNDKPATAQAVDNDSLIKRGNYLVTTLGCDDCHSPKKMGAHGPEIIPETRLSGYPADRPLPKIDTSMLKTGWSLFEPDLTAAAGPWGMSFSANITSDSTGIGNWTEVNFTKAMKEGKWKGLDNSRMLLPPMPWQNFTNMKDEDIKAIFAFLKSTKPVKNVAPAPKLLSAL